MKAEFVDIQKLRRAIEAIQSKRQAVKREQGRLRVQEHRMKRLLAEAEGLQEGEQ